MGGPLTPNEDLIYVTWGFDYNFTDCNSRRNNIEFQSPPQIDKPVGSINSDTPWRLNSFLAATQNVMLTNTPSKIPGPKCPPPFDKPKDTSFTNQINKMFVRNKPSRCVRGAQGADMPPASL